MKACLQRRIPDGVDIPLNCVQVSGQGDDIIIISISLPPPGSIAIRRFCWLVSSCVREHVLGQISCKRFLIEAWLQWNGALMGNGT